MPFRRDHRVLLIGSALASFAWVRVHVSDDLKVVFTANTPDFACGTTAQPNDSG